MKKHILFSFLLTIFFIQAFSQTYQPQFPHSPMYEIFVQSFADSDGDGIGDIKGMTAKLDYLQDLGIKGIWLMPIHPSPTYHKYDVTDYYGIHPDYGTIDDFKEFVEKAHKKDIRVIIDFVINHTSNEHPWFVSAKSSKKSPYRDYYVWEKKSVIDSLKPTREATHDTGNINEWHAVEQGDEMYYGIFWAGMPDLNFDNPKVKEEIFKAGRFWLEDVGVDGFRLDAARHIFPDDRLPDNHAFWVEFKEAMNKVKPNVYTVGEIWEETEKVAPYLKGLRSVFNFDLAYAIQNAAASGKADSLVIKHKMIRDHFKKVSSGFVDATFITNHDQNRIMSVVGGDVKKAKVAASLLLTLPGQPYIYYGEEIGMKGMKPDPLIREPFIWSKGKNNIQTNWEKLEYNISDSTRSLEEQEKDKNSLYNHYKSLLNLRNNSRILTEGELEVVPINQRGIVAFYRSIGKDKVLVVHNITGKEITINNPKVLSDYDNILFKTENSGKKGKNLILRGYSTLVLGR